MAAHRAAPEPVVDPRIPGVAPDVEAIGPWVDPVPAKPSTAKPIPAKPASRNEQLVDMQATAHAAALTLTRHTTNDPGKRWQFLNTLDRIDDPVLREKTLIGVDHDAKGGIDFMLKALPENVQMIPVIAEGRVVGLESNPPGLSISGAALTGSTGINMPKQLLSRIPPNMRDAFMTSVVDHAVREGNSDPLRGPIREGVSDGSKGIIPGIENVGQNPALMQEKLALSPAERAELLQTFLDAHQKLRNEKFDGQARFPL